MKTIIIAIPFFLYSFFVKAQTQKGSKILYEIAGIVEKDYPGYFILTKEKRQEYVSHKSRILSESINANPFEINVLANEYLSFFNDKHLSVIYFREDFPDSSAINIYRSNNKSKLEITGLWFIKQQDIILSIKKIKGVNYGYVYKDLNGFNRPGYRYLVIFPAHKKCEYNFLFFDSNGISFSTLVQYKRGKFYRFNKRIFMEQISPEKVNTLTSSFQPEENPQVKLVGESVIQIKIPSLLYDYKSKVDSLLLSYDNLIRKTKTLIIDLRGNGGGSVLPTFELVKYIKTGPIHYVNSFSVASDTLIENIKRFCSLNKGETDKFYNNYCKEFLPRLLANKGKLIFDSSEMYVSDSPPLPFPENVAILIDYGTTSAAELFVLAAKQSKKVKIFGENSSGAVDFGGVIPYFLDNFSFGLYLTTEMAEYIKDKQYDGIGIQPDIYLSKEKDKWLNEIINYYAQKK